MSTSGLGTNDAVWGYPVILGTSLGMSLVVLVTIAQLSTPPELIAIASGLVIGLRSLGGSVGLAIYNALFNGAMGHLGDNIAKAVMPLGLPPQSVGPLIGALADHHEELIPKIEGVTPQIIGAGVEALKETFATGFRRVWIAAACFVALAAILACFLKEEDREFNMRIDNPIEKEEELYSDRERDVERTPHA